MHRRRSLAALVVVAALLVPRALTGVYAWATLMAPASQGVVEDLVAANRIMVGQDVLDAFGHVSIRHPETPSRFLMSRSLAPALVKAEDIMEFDLDGDPTDQ